MKVRSRAKILFLGYSDQDTSLIHFLEQNGCDVTQTNDSITSNSISVFDLVVSFGYSKIIRQEVLKAARRPIVNLHISYLPFNRGAHPNFWAFVEKTPHGVSIHHIDEGIDTGPLVVQREISFSDLSQTFAQTYAILRLEIEKLFIENWDKILSGSYSATVQSHKGTFHKMRDLPQLSNLWESPIQDVLKELSRPRNEKLK